MQAKATYNMDNAACPYCGSEKTIARGYRYAEVGKKRLRLCKKCGRKYTAGEKDFLRMRYSKDTILSAVKLYKSGYSLAEAKKHLSRNDVEVSRWAILLWVRKYGKMVKVAKR
jgi:transposase-like protein